MRAKKRTPTIEEEDVSEYEDDGIIDDEDDPALSGKSPASILARSLSAVEGTEVTVFSDLRDSVITRPRFLSTRHIGLDYILGGGIPSGRLVEIYSKEESQGKSSLAAHIMAEMTQQGGLVILFDAEHGFTEERLAMFGINFDNLVYAECEHVEGVFQATESTLDIIVKKGWDKKTLIVWDSVAATPSLAQFNAEYAKGNVIGTHARALSGGFQKLSQRLSKQESYFLALNQTRNKIDVMYGDKLTTSGGRALKFYASVRIELSRGPSSWIKKGPDTVGFVMTAKTVKNKLVRPFQTTDVHFFFDKGIDIYRGLFNFLEDRGIVNRSGAWYTIEGRPGSFQQKDFYTVLGELSDEAKMNIVNKLKADRITPPAIAKFFPGLEGE